MKTLFLLVALLVRGYSASAQTDFNKFWGESQTYVSYLLCNDRKWQQQSTEAVSSTSYTVKYTEVTPDPEGANVMMVCYFDNTEGLKAIAFTYLIVELEWAMRNKTLPKMRPEYAQGVEGPDGVWRDKKTNVARLRTFVKDGIIDELSPWFPYQP